MARWLLSGHNPRETFGFPYPLSATFYLDFLRRNHENLICALAGGSKDFDLTLPVMVQVRGLIYMNISALMRNMARVLPSDSTSLGAPEGLVKPYAKPSPSVRLLLPLRLRRVYKQTVETYRTTVPAYRKMLDETYWALRRCDPEHLTGEDMALMARLFEPATLEAVTRFGVALCGVVMANMTLAEIVKQKVPDLLNLLVGRGTSTAQLSDRMWELGQIAAKCGPEIVVLLRRGETDLQSYRAIPEAAPLVEAVERFMQSYGHRAFRYASEFEPARLADQPNVILQIVGSLMEKQDPPSVHAEAARQAASAELEKRKPIERSIWQRVFKIGESLINVREETRDTLELQNAVWGLTARLLAHHYFPEAAPDYLSLYTFDEFLAFGRSNGQERVDPQVLAQRRAELERNRREEMPPELIWYDAQTDEWWPVEEVAQKAGTEEKEAELPKKGPVAGVYLQGIGASAGSGPVEGIAMVTDDAQAAVTRLLDTPSSLPVILVTQMTDPAWSSIFPRLVGVVTEMGGIVSHAAIVARENGLPAIVGVTGATRLILDGCKLCIDGAKGTVKLVQDVQDEAFTRSTLSTRDI